MIPRVSVIIPTYNCGLYLASAIESALNQTLPPHEIIVVNDGSTDDTTEIAARFKGLITYVSQPNSGVSVARNRALEIASGDFVAMLDADDLAAKTRFKLQVEALNREPAAVGCFTGHRLIDIGGTVLSTHLRDTPVADATSPPDFLTAVRLLTPDIPLPQTILFRRSAAQFARFPVGVKYGEDMLFCAILRSCGPFIHVADPLYDYRVRPGSAAQTQTPLDGFHQRYAWIAANREQYCPDRTLDQIKSELLMGLADFTDIQYWTRRREMFLCLRNFLRNNWPPMVPPHVVLGRKWYPEWIWQTRKGIGVLVRPVRAFTRRLVGKR